MQTLRGRVAVVTGAASGIGLALAQRFAHARMTLVLADIEADALARAQAQLQSAGANAMAVVVDVVDPLAVEALADAAYRRFGAVHVLCNNAGVAAPTLRVPTWETSLADWQWIMDVNLMGVVHGLRAFVPRMLAGGEEGHIVNTASVAGVLTGPGPYFASKHAVACVTEALYKDLKAMDARLSASVLCPGLIRTAIFDAERNRPAGRGPATDMSVLPEEAQRAAAAFRQALDKGFEPGVVADAVAEAIVADRYFVVPAQPHLHELIRTRMADITALRNPTLPLPPPT